MSDSEPPTAMTSFLPHTRPADLPDFVDPPVDEVVIGIMFMPMGGFSTNHVAKYRDAVKHSLPGLQYQPRLMVQLESLSGDPYSAQAPLPPGITLASQLIQPGQRTWLVSADDERLVQIQDDAFLSNWRKRSNTYPRFEPLMETFWERFTRFRSQLSEDVPLPLQLQQLEVSYVNWVPFDVAPVSEWFGPAKRSRLPLDGVEKYPEHHVWASSFLIEKDGVAVARLHAQQLEALRPGPGTPHLGASFQLHFRAPLPPGASDADINDLAYEARNHIVRAFTSLTTEEGHNRWGRTN